MHCSCPHASSHHRCSPQSATRGLHSYPQITLGLFLGHAPSKNTRKIMRIAEGIECSISIHMKFTQRSPRVSRFFWRGSSETASSSPERVPEPTCNRLQDIQG